MAIHMLHPFKVPNSLFPLTPTATKPRAPPLQVPSSGTKFTSCPWMSPDNFVAALSDRSR